MKYGTLILIPLILILASCKQEKKAENKPTSPYHWLLGSWHPVGDTTQLETWEKLSTLSYTGMGLKYAGTDSMRAYEYLRLYKLDDQWQFTAIVDGQNKGKEIVFIQDKIINDSILHVKNLNHDFPKSIFYELVNDSTINVILNKEMEEEFEIEMRRK